MPSSHRQWQNSRPFSRLATRVLMAREVGTSGTEAPAPTVVERGMGAVVVETVFAVPILVFGVPDLEWLARIGYLSGGRMLLTHSRGGLVHVARWRGHTSRQAKQCALRASP